MTIVIRGSGYYIRRAGTAIVTPDVTATVRVPFPAATGTIPADDLIVLEWTGTAQSAYWISDANPFPIDTPGATQITLGDPSNWRFVGDIHQRPGVDVGNYRKSVTWIRSRGTDSYVDVTFGLAYQSSTGLVNCHMHAMAYGNTDGELHGWQWYAGDQSPQQEPAAASVCVVHAHGQASGLSPEAFTVDIADSVSGTAGFARLVLAMSAAPSVPLTMPSTSVPSGTLWSSFHLLEAEQPGGWHWGGGAQAITTPGVAGWRTT